jgi:hypothetical protein
MRRENPGIIGLIAVFLIATLSCAKREAGTFSASENKNLSAAVEEWPGDLDDRLAVRVIPEALAAEVERRNIDRDVIGRDNWTKMKSVSQAFRESGLTGVSEGIYLPRAVQRELFLKIAEAKAIPPDIKLVLQDIIIQYYFFTYYYDHGGPREQEFAPEDKAFLDGLGVEYVWVEPAAQNYYQHTFLRKLMHVFSETTWGRAYREIYRRTGFRDVPAVDAGEDRPVSPRWASKQRSPGRVPDNLPRF